MIKSTDLTKYVIKLEKSAINQANKILANERRYSEKEIQNARLLRKKDYEAIRCGPRDFENHIQNFIYGLSLIHLNQQTGLIA